MSRRVQLAGIVAILGGVLWALIPATWGQYPLLTRGLGMVPLLLLGGVYGIWKQYGDTLSKVDLLPLGGGLVLLTLLAFWYGMLSGGANIAAVFVLGIPVLFGLLLVGIGSILLAYRFYAAGSLPTWAVAFVALALPLDPLFNAIITPLLGVGVSLYGLVWVVLGFYLWNAGHSDDDREIPSVSPTSQHS